MPSQINNNKIKQLNYLSKVKLEVLKSEALQMEDELYSKAYRKSAKQASYDLRKKR